MGALVPGGEGKDTTGKTAKEAAKSFADDQAKAEADYQAKVTAAAEKGAAVRAASSSGGFASALQKAMDEAKAAYEYAKAHPALKEDKEKTTKEIVQSAKAGGPTATTPGTAENEQGGGGGGGVTPEQVKPEPVKYDDQADVENINAQMKTTADKIAALTKGSTDTAEVSKQGYIKEYQKYMDDMANLQTQRTELANKQVEQAQTLSQWYSGLNKSYEDIAARYKNAVVGLGDQERQQMQSQAQQDYGAMSALAGRQTLPGQGRMQTGAQLQLAQASGQQAASSAYATAQGRMADIDQQRREMQYNIVGSSMTTERANKMAGFDMQRGMQQDISNIQMGDIAFQGNAAANRYGAASNMYNVNMQDMSTKYGMQMQGLESEFNANTYMPSANIAMRDKAFTQEMGRKNIAIQQQSVNQAGQGMSFGQAMISGGAAGAALGPWGAVGGATIGVIGKGLGWF